MARPEPSHEDFKNGPGSTHIELVGYTVSINAIHCPVGLGPAGQFAFRASFKAGASNGAVIFLPSTRRFPTFVSLRTMCLASRTRFPRKLPTLWGFSATASRFSFTQCLKRRRAFPRR